MNNEQKKSARDLVLEAIKIGEVKMRPKWHFILKAILGVIGAFIIALALLYLASFIIFISRQTGVWFAPISGFRGWYVFLMSLPWMLVSLLIMFVIVLELLVRRYSFAYRMPLLYSAAGVVLLVVAGGYVVANTSFHGRMFRYAEKNELPMAGRFYREYGHQRFKNIHKGLIEEVAEKKLIIKDRRGEMLAVLIVPDTRLDFGADFSKGDLVVVFGNRDDHTVRALGIRKISKDNDFNFMWR